MFYYPVKFKEYNDSFNINIPRINYAEILAHTIPSEKWKIVLQKDFICSVVQNI